ncbi:MAG: glycerol-3-phosphate 1-O-acyltransferase PlsY [Planctomycetes bacterium]|nr:glycerol-3-phosphate 1-O-acyltransferase PlsY [Planctomycetota bacterium]
MFWSMATILVLGSYLLGSLPFGLLLGLSRGVDIRRTGSGNIGATNLGRVLGRRWAAAAFLLDFAKGLGAVFAARLLPLEASDGQRSVLAVACGAAAVVGHIFPLYLKFRGGKGVATTFGAMAALAWIASLAAGIVWTATFFLAGRVVSVASIAAALCLPVAVWLSHRATILEEHLALLIVSLALALLVIGRHRSNIARLLAGRELGFRRPSPLAGPSGERAPDPPEEGETSGRERE